VLNGAEHRNREERNQKTVQNSSNGEGGEQERKLRAMKTKTLCNMESTTADMRTCGTIYADKRTIETKTRILVPSSRHHPHAMFNIP
jgi:hypothetical protein